MKRFFLIGVFCLFSIPSTALGCVCGTPEPAEAFNNARMVFIGRMLGGTEKITLNDRVGKPYVIEAGQVRFAVEEVFKGSQVPEITLQINSNKDTSCTYGLKRGETYVVYAHFDEKENTLFTFVCSRTKIARSEYAKADLNFLMNLPPAGSGGNLRGLIYADSKGTGDKPLSDVRVQISSAEGQVITAFTDQKGRFVVRQLKPGKYKVEPNFPPNYSSAEKFLEVIVDDRGTANATFVASIDGKVTGRAIDEEGNTFNSVDVEIEGDGKTVSGFSTGKDGQFEIDGVPPGQYVLYIDMRNADRTKTKPYYYPGTFRREKASVIRVGLGEKVEGLEFVLPNGSVVRTIEGQVTWKDGTPAAEVDVLLLCQQSSTPDGLGLDFSTRSLTDEQGRFRLQAFKGETYLLEARGRQVAKDELIEMHSSLRISAGESVKDVKLMLTNNGHFSRGDCGKF